MCKPMLAGAALLALAASVTTSARATPVASGIANITGNLTIQDDGIAFAPAFTATPGAQQTGPFAGLTGGTIRNLAGSPSTGPLPTPASGFAAFTAGLATPLLFDLTDITPGAGTQAGCLSAAVGSLCTPTGSPFTFLQLTSNTVIASFLLNGVSYSGSSATGTSPTVAVFSSTLSIDGTIPEIYNRLTTGGSVNFTYSASVATTGITPPPPVPEPASLALFGTGLAGFGLIRRRRRG